MCMSIFSFIGNILTDLFGKSDDWGQIYKQSNSNFYSSKKMHHKNNVLRRKRRKMFKGEKI